MKLFKVTVRKSAQSTSGCGVGTFGAFASENTIADDAAEAAKKVAKDVKSTYPGEKDLYVSDVELLGVVTVE